MAIEIHLPDIGADSADVTEILVNVGDAIEVDTPLISVEGDKAAMEVPSPNAGTVTEIKLAVGDSVSTGTPILMLDPAEGDAPPAESEPVTENEKPAEPVIVAKEVSLPDVGTDAVNVTDVHVAVGDEIEEEQPLISVEGDKAAMEVPSPHKGKVTEIKVATGDSVGTGTPLLVMEVTELPTAAKPSAPAAAPALGQAPTQQPVQQVQQSITGPSGFVDNREYAHASPSVRRVAREFGVNLAKVRGSGRKGRILKEDVQNYVKEALRILETGGGGGDALGLLPWPEVDFDQFGDTENQKLTKIKKLTGANLHRNWVRIPHVTQWDDVDVTDLEALRKKLNAAEAEKESGIKFTLLVFVMKAVAAALQQLPQMNSSLSSDEKNIVLKKYVNIGIAVDTPNGLVVPVVRDVHEKDCVALTHDLRELSGKARDGKLTKNDMTGGTFTISSLGGLGGTQFTPIINAPEVGILGLSRADKKPVWNGEAFEPRLMLPLSLSYDHRVIDGAEGVRFLNALREALDTVREELQA
jgi:pyruvate dehydrogenase E2 component (dihydrolipoamide acetyltransferase)